MAILLDMSRTHVPVLAGELIDLTAPAAGETAVDCTFGAGGHARLVADRLGPTGTLVCIDRDPTAEERFEELARDAPCQTRFLRMDYADGLELLGAEGLEADLVYLDLGISSMQADTRERGFSYSYDAPLDMRMDPTQDLDARDVVNSWDERRLAQVLRRYGEEPNARRIAREIERRRRRAPLETTGDLVEAIEAALPFAAASAEAIRPSAPSRRSASRSTPSSTPLTGPCRWRGRCCVTEEGWGRSPSTRSRTDVSSASWPTGHAAASARPICPSAPAAASRRPSS